MSVKNLADRIRILSQVTSKLSELGSPGEKELEQWVSDELGDLRVLESFQKRGSRWVRGVAPERLLIIGAGNLEVSLWQSIVVGLLLGSELWIKPASGTEADLKHFLKKIPISLRAKIRILRHTPLEVIRVVDAVIALGSDETIEVIQKSLHPKQRFVGYGHRISALWIGIMPTSKSVFDRIALDIATYHQQGCLSPRWIWLSPEISSHRFAEQLGEAMKRWCASHARLLKKSPLSPTEEALIYEARQMHLAQGNDLMVPPASLAWTVIIDQKGIAELSSLPRVIPIRKISPQRLVSEFSWMAGDLSTVGVYGKLSKVLEEILIRWGASRICPVGEMQRPGVSWLHDGRPQIADLVRWVEKS